MYCNWSYRWLWSALWVLGIEPTCPGRTDSSLNCWIISLVSIAGFFFFIVNFVDDNVVLQWQKVDMLVSVWEDKWYHDLCFGFWLPPSGSSEQLPPSELSFYPYLLWLSLSPTCHFNMRTCVIHWSRVDNPKLHSNLKILDWIVSFKSLLPGMNVCVCIYIHIHRFWVLEFGHLWEGSYSSTDNIFFVC